ncbi:uncharacterized protein LOC144213377 isoform X4 [Stigmatopora nigra]
MAAVKTTTTKLQEELFDVKQDLTRQHHPVDCKLMQAKVILHRLEGFGNDLGADGQQSVDLEGEVELPQIKEEEPVFPQQQMRDKQHPFKGEADHFTWSLGFRENVSPDGQEFFGLKELPRIKEKESEFPQQQIREEQLPIQKEEDDVTWSPGEALTRQDDLGEASGGAEPTNTSSWPQIKEEGPEFSQQTIIDEQLPIKNEEDYVTWSPGESVKWGYLGVAGVGVEPGNAATFPQIIEQEPEFPEQCKREEQPPINNEDCVKWSTSEPFKSEDDLGVTNRGAELPSGSSIEGWRAENVIAPLSDDNNLLFDNDDVEDVKKNPRGDKLCNCLQCGKTFGKKSSLKRHMRSHTGEKSLSCTVCGKIFTHKGKFKMHTRTHTVEKPFSCSVCGQTFTQKGSLKRHTKTHTGEKPFSCSVCGQVFARKEILKSHASNHTGKKPFSCSVCGHAFARKGHLNRYARTHTGEKPIWCSVCGKRYKENDHLKIHTRTHTGENHLHAQFVVENLLRREI